MIDRRPDAIIRCADVTDVIKAANYARNGDIAIHGHHTGRGRLHSG